MPAAAHVSRQVVFPAVGTVVVDEIPVPEPAVDEVLVRVRRVGICATDLHLLDGHIGDPFPLVPGHEFVGEVAALGDEAARARGLRPGDPIAVEMLLPCRGCARCREGRYNLCEHDEPGARPGRQLGVNIPRDVGHGLWGGYADLLIAPAEAVIHRLPAGMPWDRAVLTEPLAVAHRAIARGRVGSGDVVVVIGPGPVGLLAAAAARAAGAARVIVVGTRPSRLQPALRFGADAVINTRETDDLAAAVRAELDGRLADVVIEIAGATAAQRDAVRLVRRGGRVVLAGACGAGAELTLLADEDLLTREIDVLPSFLSAGGFEPAIAQLARAEFPFEELVTHVLPLDQVEKAFALIASRDDAVIKIALDPDLRP
ncbi:zinc-binding dehydrogenase [Microbacterium sp.]|uniref:zinc-dependent alcohol dehydrogenase n=1 Tax=Microbacterium sp. TaxID=51671 RepID=UPI003342A3DB